MHNWYPVCKKGEAFASPENMLFSLVLPVYQRRDALNALEQIDKMAGILITQFRGNLRNAFGRPVQFLLCQFHFLPIYITCESLTHFPGKES